MFSQSTSLFPDFVWHSVFTYMQKNTKTKQQREQQQQNKGGGMWWQSSWQTAEMLGGNIILKCVHLRAYIFTIV